MSILYDSFFCETQKKMFKRIKSSTDRLALNFFFENYIELNSKTASHRGKV